MLLLSNASPLFVNVATAESGTITAEDQYFSCNLTTINPNSNTTYNNTMPLNLTIDWNANAAIFWIDENISYSIDNKQAILIGRNHFDFEYSNQTVTIKTESVADISNLETGQHKLKIIVNGIYNVDNDFLKPFSASFNPIFFEVSEPAIPSLTPSVPELSILMLPILTMATLFGIIALKRKHQINANK